MTQIRHCPGCGAELKPGAHFCDQCGLSVPDDTAAQPENQVADPFVNRQPATIEEMKQYCAIRGMPLEKMRFFIGEDYRKPKAFGIYHDAESDRFVVYKNKSDGSRAVRYNGPDEAYAVNEIYQKLLTECHTRGIYPENYGKPGGMRNRRSSDAGTNIGSRSVRTSNKSFSGKNKRGIIIAAVVIAVIIGGMIFSWSSHRSDGYYRYNDGYYYRYGNSWYAPGISGYWAATAIGDAVLDSAYYLGDSYANNWGISDFRDSTVWSDLHDSGRGKDSDSSSSWDVFDDWDFGGTDWDSDW